MNTPPESTGKLDSVDTNPLPHVSSAHAWNALEKQPRALREPPRPSRPLSLPKAPSVLSARAAAPVIREKARPRPDRTEEICADDIMVIVPRAQAPSSEELDDTDIVVEHQEPEFRPPAYSVHATQEILADDVLEVKNVPVPHVPVPDERPSSIPPPWTIDAVDEFAFPTPPQYSGQYAAISARMRAVTAFSATQVFRRRSANMKVVIASVSLAASVVLIAGIARFVPSSASFGAGDGPVGISVHAPKKLDTTVRGHALTSGKATRSAQAVEVAAISIDALPIARASRRHY